MINTEPDHQLPLPMTDHDRLFKELLSTFFVEFLELFLPQIAAAIDRSAVAFQP